MKTTFLNSYVLIGRVFCFIPWKIQKNTLKSNIWNKIHFFVIVSVIFGSVGVHLHDNLENSVAAILVLGTLSLVAVGTITKRRLWRRFDKLYEMTDSGLKMKLHKSIELDWKLFVYFLLYVAILFAFQIQLQLRNSYVIFFFKCWIVLMKYYTSTLTVILANILLKGLEALNHFMNFSSETDGVYHLVSSSTDKRVRTYYRIYRNLYEMSVCVNELIGWLTVMMFFECLVSLLLYLNLGIRITLDHTRNANVSFMIFSWCFHVLVSTKKKCYSRKLFFIVHISRMY